MSDLRALSADELRTHVATVSADAGHSLGAAFDRTWRLEVGSDPPATAGGLSEEFAGRGLVVGLRVGDAVLLVLVPEQLPLPEWIAAPDASQSARLQTLAQEWSVQLLPSANAADEFRAVAVDDLRASCAGCVVGEDSRAIALTAVPAADGTAAGESSGVPIVLLWPAARMPEAKAAATGDATVEGAVAEPVDAPDSAEPRAAESERNAEAARRAAAARHAAARERVRRVMQLPVPVAVRLAEKRVELSTLLSMSPGTLIMFEKSCEDLLGLYVNNQLYALGEAVKIGEKFGLKISEVGVRVVRSSPLVNA